IRPESEAFHRKGLLHHCCAEPARVSKLHLKFDNRSGLRLYASAVSVQPGIPPRPRVAFFPLPSHAHSLSGILLAVQDLLSPSAKMCCLRPFRISWLAGSVACWRPPEFARGELRVQKVNPQLGVPGLTDAREEREWTLPT